MNTKKHTVLDHVIIGYILLAIFAMLLGSLGSSLIDTPLAKVVAGYGQETEVMGNKVMSAQGVGNAVGSLIAASIFFFMFRPAFDGMLKKKDLLKGLLLLLPFLVFHWAGSVVSWFEFGTASVLIALLRAAAPGFTEEIAFRGLGVANYMRKKNTDSGIVKIFWISSFVFGFIHMMNAFSGAPVNISLIQSVYAMGVGMALAAVYLRTGNLWPTIIAHMSVDFMEFIRADLGESGGIMMGMGIGDWITIAAGVFAAGLGIYLIRKSCRAQIIELWDKKWKVEAEAQPAA